MIQKLRMPLGIRSYDIQIGPGAIHHLPKWLKAAQLRSKRAFILADEKLVEARAATRASLLKAGWEVFEIPVKAGEGLKDIEIIYPLYGRLLHAKANRDSVLFALGGGSVGDAAGFVAATFLRGIDWVGLPTTLLAQVDSSVGGKTGINHSEGKNLIGGFHQPRLVVCDIDFLATLSPREVISGLGETVKYGIVFDPAFFSYLEKNSFRFISRDPEVLAIAIKKSLQWKCKAVAGDEFDRKGGREVLNFGHTFGHALEALTGYGTFQHGEAVIWGMRFALSLSRVRKKLPRREWLRIDGFLRTLEVPGLPPAFGPNEYLSKMSQDKKVREGKIHFVLLKKIGEIISDGRVSETDLQVAYRLLLEEGRSTL